MLTLKLEDANTQSLLLTMFRDRSVVPVLGAGFSKGARTHGSHVPDADEFSGVMLECLRAQVGADADSLSGKRFSDIAEYFLNPEFVPTDTAKKIIRTYFTGVTLTDSRRSFLECPWPYIYTLNIDDAIEGSSPYRQKIVPNRPISDAAKQFPCVYKVHGDATEELVYDEPSKIIFSTGQYVRSLMTNQSMLNALKTDLTEQNTLFVGCSLDQEVDLLYALAEFQGTFPEGRRSIYVTRKQLNRFELAKLSAHGINAVLQVPDYESFYSTLSKWGRQAASQQGSLIQSSLVSGKKLRTLDHDRAANISFLLRDAVIEKERDPVLPDYCARRDIEDAILRASQAVPLVLVRGRRFSGKTMLMRSLASSAKAKNVYLVSSEMRISEEVLEEMCAVTNGLFLIDANVLTPDTAYSLTKHLRTLRSNDSAFVVAVNRTEPDVVGALVRHVSDDADFELETKLSQRECLLTNKELDALGILRLDCRKTMLDNTFLLLGKYPDTNSLLLKSHALSEKEVELLLVVAIVDKVYSSLATALDVRTTELFALCERLAPILDVVETSRAELRDTNSRHKLVANSKIGLAFQVQNEVKEKGYGWLSERFSNVVKRLIVLPKFASTAHSMYMFDAVNYVLSQTSYGMKGTGYRPVVRSLYESLQNTLNSSPDYWLQRAKAVLNLEDDVQRLSEGVEFALKSYHEAERERTVDNAEFSIALLYGKLCVITKFKEVKFVQLAIEWFARAIRNYHKNPNYVRRMIEEQRHHRNWYSQLCDHLEAGVSDVSLLPFRGDVRYLLTVREQWRTQGR